MKRVTDLLVVLVVPLLGGCGPSRPEEQAASARLRQFQDANFGVRFSHTEALAIDYNPHGGADRVMMAWRGKAIGGLLITRRPPPGKPEDFIAAGKDYYREKFNTSVVRYRLYQNPHGYKFHHLRAAAPVGADDYVFERFVYIQKAKKAASPDLAFLQELFAAFSFEFGYRAADRASIRPEIMTVVDSFRIKDGL